jgi:predicted ATPase with chaperone activity
MDSPQPSALSALAPRPGTLRETGLSQAFLADLICKHLIEAGVLDLGALAQRLALSGSLTEELLAFLRTEGRVEVMGAQGASPFLRFGLTERGRAAAANALARDGYIGPAPVPLATYRRIVREQSARLYPMNRERVHAAFADTVIRPDLLDRLGPAVNSGRPIFIHGAPGTGKTFIARRLSRLLGPPVLIPHALLFGESVVRCFDPGVHRLAEQGRAAQTSLLGEGFDPRYLVCERPLVVAGGELTLDMLELTFNPTTSLYQAPLQLRANNGMLVIDDLGRQRLEPAALFNRWIVPLEEGEDHLSVKTGQHHLVPFDLVLVLSTNLNPLDLTDEAFLRRIGYKIHFQEASRAEYDAIFKQECEGQGIPYNPALVEFLVDGLHGPRGIPLLACHPRDLLGLALDWVKYRGADLDENALRWAWDSYFVADIKQPTSSAGGGTKT